MFKPGKLHLDEHFWGEKEQRAFLTRLHRVHLLRMFFYGLTFSYEDIVIELIQHRSTQRGRLVKPFR